MRQARLWGILIVGVAAGGTGGAHAAAVSGQGTWESTLQGRDLDGDLTTAEAYYDTVLGITWLADANYAATTGYAMSGRMNWNNAYNWARYLDINGVTGWRLPTTVDVGTEDCTYTSIYQGVDCHYNIMVHSEMSHLFYVTLGDKAYYDTSGNPEQAGWGLTNTGLFANIQSDFVYWSNTEYGDSVFVWHFHFYDGRQLGSNEVESVYGWAVHDGDVGAPVPMPAAVWLFGSGLIGLAGLAARNRSR